MPLVVLDQCSEPEWRALVADHQWHPAIRGLFGMKILSWRLSWLPAVTLAGLSWLAIGPTDKMRPESGAKPAPAASPSAQLVGGIISRLSEPAQNRLTAQCYIEGVRSAKITRILRTDQFSLLLRRSKDGRLSRVKAEDLTKEGGQEVFQALIHEEPDPEDHSQHIFWLIAYPRLTERPIPHE
ncbi:MAG TPA: hypothetical protein VFT74_17275 [Isosphaeraceae bacterium]|nr:hypothetical protein [Isosphaeraceae bacterium]